MALAKVAWETKGEDVMVLHVAEQASWCRCALPLIFVRLANCFCCRVAEQASWRRCALRLVWCPGVALV